MFPWGTRYQWEQRTFSWGMIHRLRRGDIDIVHVADPLLAELLRRQSRTLNITVVYKDGLLLGPDFSRRFDWVQVLAPYYLERGIEARCDTQRWAVIPHLVHTDHFRPSQDRNGARAHCPGGPLPADVLLAAAVGDFSAASNKRLDHLIEEFASIQSKNAPHLLLAGQAEGTVLRQFSDVAKARLGSRAHVRPNILPEQMPALFASADFFVHGALREPFGIVFLEAMASGLPIIAHHWAVTQWILGDGGTSIDMEARGSLARHLVSWQSDPGVREAAALRARARAELHFDRRKIVPLYVDFQRKIRESMSRES